MFFGISEFCYGELFEPISVIDDFIGKFSVGDRDITGKEVGFSIIDRECIRIGEVKGDISFYLADIQGCDGHIGGEGFIYIFKF